MDPLSSPVSIDYSQVRFDSRLLVDGLPNSVVFDIYLKDVRSDSILIQQYWDPRKTITINNNQTQATGIYYYPEYFKAKLLIDRNVIREHDIFIKSPGWVATLDYAPVPSYLSESLILGEDGLFLPQASIDKIKLSEEPLQSTFHYVDDLGSIAGDEFVLKTRLRHIYSDKWAVCQKTQIIILGLKEPSSCPFLFLGVRPI